jgi:hypothetical protein
MRSRLRRGDTTTMAKEKGMTYLEAAIAVLESCQRPMSAREITDEAISRGLLKPSGKTPVRTMEGVLYVCAQDARIRHPVRFCEMDRERAKRGTVRWALP